ncbi:uncharacterized protein HD556DRAFT_1314825 [Suillus plorans]|uniref:Uncharacterized protein n=1 Tax=Suillus plorans TaxID=116603 RepID=A0A9P7A9T7_9AGAM|nr:uncharacterized protein HD556DRAFT_1314825 [Suillus plorans]KAG1784753.1 hypothetical protein HD556DRAFT_1314825 [Suillus plorans]
MPGASWMSREQSAWLSEKMDGFQLSQLQGNVSTYLSEVNAQWFTKWPEAAVHFKDETGVVLTEEQLSKEQHISLGHHLKQRKAQLRSYFYRNASAVGRARITQFTKTITKLMGSSTERTRGPTAVKHFIHTEYQSGSSVKEDIQAHLKNGEYTRQNRMSGLRVEAAKAMSARGQEYVKKMEWEAKMECERRAEKAKAELEALHNPDESARMQYIEGLSAVVGQLLQTIQETTGWYGSIYLGGPDPRVAGDVRVFSFHHGKGSTGLTFREALPDHHSRLVEPFTMFLKGAFATSPDFTLPAATHASSTVATSPDLTLPVATHASSTVATSPDLTLPAANVLPDEIRQDESFDNSLGFLGASLEPLMMSDDTLLEPLMMSDNTLYEGSMGASIEPPMMSDDTLYTIGPEEHVDSWQMSLPTLPPYPGQLTPPRLRSAMARLGSGSVNRPRRPRPRPYKGKSKSMYDRFGDSPPSSPVPSRATQTPSLAEVIPPPLPAAFDLPPTTSFPSAMASSPTAAQLLEPVTPSPLPAMLTTSPATSSLPTALTTSMTSSLPAALTTPATPALTTPATPSLPAAPTKTTSPASKASQVPAPITSSPRMRMPLEDIPNQSVRRSSRTHVPSTRLAEANSIGTHKRARKPRKSAP